MTDLMPFCDSFGVGAAAREPSPRNRGPSSHFVICAASLIVNGRTRTVTEIELAAPSAASMALGGLTDEVDEGIEWAEVVVRSLVVGHPAATVTVVSLSL